MIESTQIILTAVVVLLSLILVVIGIQVFLILNEFRRALRQFNRVISDFRTMTETATETFKTMVEKSTSFAGAANLLNLFLSRRRKNND
jgi:hypothetical protein